MEEYLRDPTGNRRYWPVTVAKADYRRIEEDRDQVFAEAVELFKQGAEWHLTPDEASAAKTETEERMEEDPWTEIVLKWTKDPRAVEDITNIKKDVVEITTSNILQYAILKPKGQWSRSDQMRVASILKRHGWTKLRQKEGERTYVWDKKSRKGLSSVPFTP
jgi:predicted P-loop ATPase